MKRRVRKLTYSGLYVIDELVISGKHWASGSYITWPGFYQSKTKAIKTAKSVK